MSCEIPGLLTSQCIHIEDSFKAKKLNFVENTEKPF